MDRIPNGRYQVEYIQGVNWSLNKTLPNGISRGGFLVDQKTNKVNQVWNFSNNKSLGYKDCVTEGSLTSDEISEEQFFNQ
jgi:hypothetical protein